jgi:SAM-dependent methyltransferase
MRGVLTPALTRPSTLSSLTTSLRRSARDVHRRLFCYSLALAPERSAQAKPPSLAVRLASTIPFGAVLRQQVRHRPGMRTVPVAALLMGSQAGLDSPGFARAFGTLRYGSMPMDQSPYVELLRLASRTNRPLTDDEIRASAYYAFSRHLASIWGNYFGATTDDELVRNSRSFIEWSKGSAPRLTVNIGGSRFDDHVLVAKVADSTTYQVIDGHHRLAIAMARGDTTVRVNRTWLSAETALQRRLWERGHGLDRAKALAQPVAARELGAWPVARNCVDRLVRIERVAHDVLGPLDAPHTFLDVGCGYGWYLAELKRLGWRVHGIDRDGFGIEMASAFHDIADDEITVGEWATSLAALEGTYDVVTCLDLGRLGARPEAAVDATSLVRALDARTAHVLLTDAPLDDDALARIEELVLGDTGFRRVVDLGANHDPAGRGAASPSRLLAILR